MALHAVVFRQIVVVAQTLDDPRFPQNVLFALLERMDIV